VPVVLLVSAALLAHEAVAESLRCEGKLIQVGDPKARLVAVCGQPLSREVVAVTRVYAEGRELRVSYVEEWSYATDGVEGFQLLRFDAGRLVGEGMRCAGGLVRSGDTTVTVLQKCGEPVSRDAAGLAQEPPGPASPAVVSDVSIEQWVYSQGEGSLLDIVTLRGGRVESIETGPRR
jgi:hypothetical protein